MTTPTVPSAIRDSIVTAIEAITPAETEQSSRGWVHVRSMMHVEGSEIRTFALRLLPVNDGPILGCGNDFTFHCRIYTSYHGLQHFDADPLIIEDQRQLLQTLSLLVETVTGLRSITWEGTPFTYEREDEGEAWGYHQFLVRYLASDTP